MAPINNKPPSVRAASNLTPAQRSTAPAATAPTAPAHNPYALQSTVTTAADMEAVFDRFQAEREQGKPVALVSGGSLSGYPVAMKLKNLGFNVITAEARAQYTRSNVPALKEEAIHSLAHLSPDGSLMNSLLESNQMSMRQSRIVQKDGEMKQVLEPARRFTDWLAPEQTGNPLPPRIPVREEPTQKLPAFIDADPNAAKKHEPMEHLALEWPNKEVVQAMDPKDYHHPNMERLSKDTLGIGMIRDLEAGLNKHAVQQGIEVAHARVALKDEGTHFTPELNIGGQTVSPKFPVDLIVVAEGKGANTTVVSPQQNLIKTDESWHQRNYVLEPGLNAGSSVVADPKDTSTPPLVPIRINRKDDSVLNVAYYARRSENGDDVWAQNADRTQATLQAAGSKADANNPDIVEYRSPRIDVDYRRSETLANKNAVLVGDSAGTGSPSAGAGASLAMSIYPEAVEQLVKSPDFKNPETREKANAVYSENVGKGIDVWQRKTVDVMRKLDLMTSEKAQEVNASSGKVKALKEFAKKLDAESTTPERRDTNDWGT